MINIMRVMGAGKAVDSGKAGGSDTSQVQSMTVVHECEPSGARASEFSKETRISDFFLNSPES